jgi:uncharacterized repeat protein (TIGR02543 family)
MAKMLIKVLTSIIHSAIIWNMDKYIKKFSMLLMGVMLSMFAFLGGCSSDPLANPDRSKKQDQGFYYIVAKYVGDDVTAIIIGLVDEETERDELIIPEYLGGYRVSCIGYFNQRLSASTLYYGIHAKNIKKITINFPIELYSCGIQYFEGDLYINTVVVFSFVAYYESYLNIATNIPNMSCDMPLFNVNSVQFNAITDTIGDYDRFVQRLTMRQHFEVMFNSLHGEQETYSIVIKRNNLLEKPTLPSKTGFAFNGWFTDAELTTEWDFKNDIVTENIMLYAKWLPN